MKHSDVVTLLRRHGLVDRRRRPELAAQIDWLARTGRLVRILPSIYVAAADAAVPEVRIQAVVAWDPDAVITGAAAARLTYLPNLPVPEVGFTSKRRCRARGFLMQRRRIPSQLIMERHGLRCTVPALTALDLCRTHGGDAIDTVLRTRAATLTQLWDALRLTPERPGNLERRRLLIDSRSEPWSEAERRFHRLLRAAGINGWVANRRVAVHGRTYYLDVAFDEHRVALEVDGLIHVTAGSFERDRSRQNDLVLAGWLVLRFTWSMITEQPGAVVLAVITALESRRQSAS
ncbi:endonuclease domain-containing protein [Microlunatus parietis]|uniref:Very-short-patch-repair endonuclease n=1 Tax=Microlunatus parietis TaxID=682979 RepID=A0A7Y9I2R0_9ACTN|nr:DUF559 domain-containing protein [Microlunatus parietis]NYE69042.1 very-short-patch-repair endonuclease [Microlunatus parietis]